jgi:hypothetical protein
MEPIDKQLIAPCGMNCAICSGYLAYKNKLSQVRGKCKGCRPRNKQCAFLKKRCADNLKLLKGEIDFCFECHCFPCHWLERLDNSYKQKYGMSMIENLIEIKNKGIQEFIKNQYKKYKCPICGSLISVHNKKCFSCEKIESLKG